MTAPANGPRPEAAIPLPQRYDLALTELAKTRVALMQFAEPAARHVMYAVDTWCDIALSPSDPRRAEALQLLRAWKATMARVDQALTGIVPASSMPAEPGP